MVLYYLTNKQIQSKKQMQLLMQTCSGDDGERVLIQLLLNKLRCEDSYLKIKRIKQIINQKVAIIKAINDMLFDIGLVVYNADIVDEKLKHSIEKNSEDILNIQKILIIKYYCLLSKMEDEQNKKILSNIIKISLNIRNQLQEIFN